MLRVARELAVAEWELADTVLDAAELARPGGDREARRAAVERAMASAAA